MKVVQAYRFALAPTPAQERALRMLGYKTAWNGGTLLLAGRWFPSSKKCSGCGAVKAKLPLSERTYQCEHCGLVMDRDVNAARNLLNLAASGAESLNACGGTVRPRPARHDPANQEPGTANAGQTGTASPQGAAAARTPKSAQPQRRQNDTIANHAGVMAYGASDRYRQPL